MEGNAQIPSCVVMIRPHKFYPNPETAEDNKFQGTIENPKRQLVANAAYDDVTRAADLLKNEGIRVVLFEDSSSKTPDSCYPNNWFSTHPDGSIVLYPMYAPNRRLERRVDVIRNSKVNMKSAP